jgi:hypothetical protein
MIIRSKISFNRILSKISHYKINQTVKQHLKIIVNKLNQIICKLINIRQNLNKLILWGKTIKYLKMF